MVGLHSKLHPDTLLIGHSSEVVSLYSCIAISWADFTGISVAAAYACSLTAALWVWLVKCQEVVHRLLAEAQGSCACASMQHAAGCCVVCAQVLRTQQQHLKTHQAVLLLTAHNGMLSVTNGLLLLTAVSY